MLVIEYTKDPVCLRKMIDIQDSQGLLPSLTMKEMRYGNWCVRKKPAEAEGIFRD
jgi:hypothetical protein